MFAGHVGAALVFARAERRINVGVFVFAALFLDVLLWLFVLLGLESIAIPVNYSNTHQLRFDFPYSHGLFASIAWSALAGVVAFLSLQRATMRRFYAAIVVGAAVFSHWLLDALVVTSQLPIFSGGSTKVGLGLWENIPIALAVEALIVMIGLCVFLPGAGLPRPRKLWLSVLCALVLAFTVAGMTIAPPPPSPLALTISSLATVALMCLLSYWLGKHINDSERPGT